MRSSTQAKVVFGEVLHPIELEFGNAGLWEEGTTEEAKRKPLGEENQLNPHEAPSSGSNPGHIEVSAITTTPSLLPILLVVI